MKTRRLIAGAAATAATALVLAACNGGAGDDDTADGDDEDDLGISQETAVNVGWNQAFYEYNNNSPTGNNVTNSNVMHFIKSDFRYYDGDLALQRDTSFGEFEVVNEDPLQVEFIINDDVNWSDGTPVDAADLLLAWAAHSGVPQTVEGDEVETDDENQIVEESIAGEVYFAPPSSSIGLIEEVPEITNDGKGVIIEYSVPFVDWELTFGVGVPAHVVAMHALDIDDAQEAKDEMIRAIQENDSEALAPISEFWRTGFQFGDELPEDESLYLSNGAYLITDFRGGQYLTLEANPDYVGDFPASIETVTFRYNENPLAQVQALENGELDISATQAIPDVLQRLEELGDDVTLIQGDGATYEHIDLKLDNDGPFSAGAYDGDEETALNVRKAFLNLIPRQTIVDRLITPLNPEAVVRQSFTQVPGSEGYDVVSGMNGLAEAYPVEGDPEAAQQFIDDAGVETPINVRFLFAAENERRMDQFTIIKEAVEADGLFTLEDNSSATWSQELSGSQDYDAALFGWQSTSLAVSGSDANFRTAGFNNSYGYSNPEVDSLLDELRVELDGDRQVEILGEVEQHLVEDAFGTVIFQFPELSAHRNNVTGVDSISLLPTLFYNYYDWEFVQ